MHKAKLVKIIGVLLLALFITQGGALSYASESMYDMLQRDGKLRLIIKFKDFVSDRISVKIQEGDLVVDNEINEYILRKIDDKYNLKKLKKLFNDGELARTTGGFAREFSNYFVIEIDRDEEDAEWITSRLQRFYEVDMVEVDLEMSIEATALPNVDYIPNDYYVTSDNVYWREGAWGQAYPNMWGLQKTQTFEAWDRFGDARNDPGKDIVVGVVDTGVKFSVSDLSANRWVNPGEIAGNGRDDDGNGYVDDINGWDFVNNDNNPVDDQGHGTHCAGTIAAVTNNSTGVAGIAPNATIMALKGLGADGRGNVSWLANCIIYGANNGADVLSNSWGGYGSSSTVLNAVNYAYSRGCVVVGAAGNNNRDAYNHIPSAYTNCIAVAATDHNDVKSWFSNFGTSIDVSAPGSYILSTTMSSYGSWSGTSMACPHVSGLAALILSLEPSLTNAEVRARIRDTADNIYGQNPSYQGLLGTGRINMYRAILAGGPVNRTPVLSAIGNKAVNEGETLSFTVLATDQDGDDLIYSVVDELPGELTRSGDSNFFIQMSTVYGGLRALQSGSVETGESSIITKSLDLDLDGTLTFYWKVSSAEGSGELSFSIDGEEQDTISGDVDWEEKTYDLDAGTYTLTWTYERDAQDVAGSDAGWIDSITIEQGTTATYDLEDGLIPDGFTTGGDSSFYVQSQVVHWGSKALEADPSLVDLESEYIETFVTTGDGAEVSFYWMVSSEYYYDFLEFYIDDTLKNKISGNTSWAKKTYSLTAGTHTLKWRYMKDYSVTRGEDTGWVDDIVIVNGSGEAIDFELVDGVPSPLPDGASFNAGTRQFTWTPTYEQSGTYSNLRFVVTEDTEDELSDYEDIAITAYNVNRPPVLDAIGGKTVNEMDLLEFTISATDPEGDDLAYSASGLPEGASFDADTRTFSWIPTYLQSGTYEDVHFEVSELGGGIDEYTQFMLHGDGLDGSTLILDSSFSDHTVSTHGTAQLDSSALKWGTASIDLDGNSDYLTVSDHGDWDLITQTSFTIDLWVKHTDHAGVEFYMGQWEDIYEGWMFFHNHGHGLRFQVNTNSSAAVAIGYGGEITDTNWHHIAVCKVGDEYGLYKDGVQVAYKNDPDSATYQAVLRIGQRVDSGYFFDGHMDEIRITHSNPFGASPDSGFADTITAPTREYSEGGSAPGGNMDSEDITITVINMSDPPVLDSIGDQSVDENELLEFTITATDTDGDDLIYSASNLPSGASFNAETQAFSWTPGYDQAGTYSGVTFSVTDSTFIDEESITITVSDVNRKPVINSLTITPPSAIIDEGESITIVIDASDPDGDSLDYNVQNEPDGAGFVDDDFYWATDYGQDGTYSDITFTVYDGDLYSDSSDAVTITVTNTSDEPVFITEPTLAGSYYIDGEAKDVSLEGDYAYVAYGAGGLKVLDISDINNIFEQDAIATYTDLGRINIFSGYAYLIDMSTLAGILDVSIPSTPYIRSDITEPSALDIAVDSDVAYLACGDTLSLYDLTNIDSPEEITGYDLGKADRIVVSGDYAYAISADEDLKTIDVTTYEALTTTSIEGAETYDAKDIAISGNNVYVAKDGYGITAFGISDPLSHTEDGELDITDTDMKEVESFVRNRLFAIGYDTTSDNYNLVYIDSSSSAAMAELWTYSFAQGLVVNSLHADGNRLFVADEDGVDIIVAPLEDSYTVEAETELKITVIAEDPDEDSVIYSMNNEPDFSEADFTDNGDGTATFTWTPAEDQIGIYEDISFAASDEYQEATSGSITITVVQKDAPTPPIDEDTKLLLHCNGEDGSDEIIDSSPSAHKVMAKATAQLDTSIKKWGTASLDLDGNSDYLTVSDNDDWDILDQTNFTIDLWVKHTDNSSAEFYIGQWEDIYEGWMLFHNSGYGLRFQVNSDRRAIIVVGYGGEITDTEWHHVAVCKVGTEYGLYKDGVQVSYKNDPDTAVYEALLRIGHRVDDGYFFDGHTDEVRISHSNIFSALPNSGLSDTITVPTREAR